MLRKQIYEFVTARIKIALSQKLTLITDAWYIVNALNNIYPWINSSMQSTSITVSWQVIKSEIPSIIDHHLGNFYNNITQGRIYRQTRK